MNRKTSTLLSLGISIALIAVGIWFLCNHQNNLVYDHSGWIMPYPMMTGGSGMGMVLILFWVAVLSAIGLVISGMISNRSSSGHTSNEKPSRKTKSLKQRKIPHVAKACGRKSQGAKGEAEVIYCEPLATPDLASAGVPGG